jgi:sulfate permease, SulP family
MPRRRPAIPLLETLRGYDARTFRGDLQAGLTTAVMLIPQGMAYAMLAGLPPIHGLYASLAPLVAYAVFGTSRHLSVGPVALDSLLVAAGVGAMAAAGSERYVALAIALALMVGLIQVVMGAARLGFVVNFLSRPVLGGFVAAAALIIAGSQLPQLLGIPMKGSTELHAVLWEVGHRLGETHLPTLLIAAVSLILLLALGRWWPIFPRALAAVVGATVVVWALGLKAQGVAVVGAVPSGLPAPSLPDLAWGDVGALLPIALTIAFVAFIEAIAVGKRMARQHGYDVAANRELVALGAANLAASLTRGYPVAGGLSRTAVNAEAGARTGVAGLITAGAVALTLAALTPLLHHLPKATLAAIIVTAVVGLIDVRQVARLWRVKRADLAMLAVTFVATLALGIQHGILVGVGTSLALLVARTAHPHVAVLGRVPGTGAYRNVERFPDAETLPGVLAVRLDAQLYFGNVNFLKETLQALEERVEGPLRAVVIDASGMNQIDASAEAALCEILADYRARNVRFMLATVKGPVRDVLSRSGFLAHLGEPNLTLRLEDAMTTLATDPPPPQHPPERPWARPAGEGAL